MSKLCFNTQPPEGGWEAFVLNTSNDSEFQHTAARRRLGHNICHALTHRLVSTHSRPKAAGRTERIRANPKPSFNTQPPEGGWCRPLWRTGSQIVSTHSRPKAAGTHHAVSVHPSIVSTHSRPKAAGDPEDPNRSNFFVSTHSRPKAAGLTGLVSSSEARFQHTAARRRLELQVALRRIVGLFQHTAARRRLVSNFVMHESRNGFNTQPPEGGWLVCRSNLSAVMCFNTQPPEGGWQGINYCGDCFRVVSTHSRPKAAGPALPPARITATVSTHSRPKAAGASLKSLAPSGFAAPISLSSQEKQKCEYNTAFSVIPTFAIS